MKKCSFFILMLILLNGCAAQSSSQYTQHCFNTTQPLTFARISCISDANAKEARDIQVQQQQATQNRYLSKCDGYGFTRGTTAYAQCLQQAETQDSIDSANQMQANELHRQNQERLFRKSQCYLSARTDC